MLVVVVSALVLQVLNLAGHNKHSPVIGNNQPTAAGRQLKLEVVELLLLMHAAI